MELCVYFGPKYGHFKEKPMFIDCRGAFSSTMKRKEDEYVFWEPTHEFVIDFGIYKENTKSIELNRFYCVQ